MAYPNTSARTQDSPNGTHDPRRGFFPWLRALFFGEQAARLREQASRTHWLSYLLIIAQSVAVVLVFGHAEVGLLLSANTAVSIISALALNLLVITVTAADLALLETLTRIPALARNRQHSMLREHIAYVLFVLAVEGSTYGVVLYTLDSDPQALVRSAPLIPTAGLIFLALVVMRVLLICWSAVQLIIVRGKLPVLLSTLTSTGKEIVGAHVERQLASLDIGDVALPDTFAVYAAMAKPPRPIRGFFNGWLVRRALEQEAEEERQAGNVLTALASLDAHRLHSTSDSEQSTSGKELPVVLPAPQLPPDHSPDQPPDHTPDEPPDGPQDGGRDDIADERLDHYWPNIRTWEPSSLPGGKSNGRSGGRERGNGYHPASRSTDRTVERSSIRATGGKKRGKLTAKRGRTMLANAARRHQRVEQVRAWLAAGEAVSKRRIRAAFGVDNDAATNILAEARRAALQAV